MKDYIKDKKIEWYQFIALCAVLFIDCMLFNSSGYNIGRLFAVLIVVATVFFDIQKSLFVIAFCLPFSSILKLSDGGITIIPILYLIVICKLLITERVNYSASGIIAIAIFICFQILACIAYNANLISIISFLLSIVFVFMAGEYLVQQKNNYRYLFVNLVLFFVGALCLETICADLFTQIPNYISAKKHLLLENAGRYAALNIDPNEYTQLVLIALGLLIAIFPMINSKIIKAFCIIPFAFLVSKGFLTYSKSYAITLLFLFFILSIVFLFQYLKKHGTSALFIIIPFFIIVIIGGVLIYENVLKVIFEKRQSDDLLTGRGDIWLEYLNALRYRLDCLILGCGASNTVYLAPVANDVPHNLYIEYLVQFGIIGLVSLICVFKTSFKNISKNARSYLIIPILAFAVTSFGISANASDVVFFVLIIVCLPYKQITNKK